MLNESIKILITGANGMLGSDLIPLLREKAFNIIPTDIEELNITKPEEVEKFFDLNKPDITIHCAAYTNVDKAEEEPQAALLINETGTKNIAESCQKHNSKLIYISTDYVFNGTKASPYEINDPTDPINIYGLSKLKGEIAAKFNPQTYIARTSWLYGINGNNFVSTMIKLARTQKELSVVNDQIGCPTWTIALSNALINIIENDMPYGIYHTCGSGYTSWYDFACEIFKLMDINVKVNPVSSSEFVRKAKRPANSIMNNNNICPHWKESLKEYIELYREKL